jgi:cytochrome c oxidase cbb3-type subunit 3
MSDFTSSFWSWFIIVLTVGGIVGVLWLVRWMARGLPPRPEGEVETMGHVWDENLEELNNPLPRWWLYMFYGLTAFAVLYLVLYPGLGAWRGLLGWTQTEQYYDEVETAEARYAPIFEQYLERPVPELAADPEAVRVGARLFGTYCAVCHGADARGARGFPNLADDSWLYGGSPEAIRTSILDGRQGNMPGWEQSLGREGVLEVVEYVRSLSGESISPTAAAAGEPLFAQYCAACHGADATGNQALGAPDLTDRVWLYGGSQRDLLETVARGRQGVMPAHEGFLGEAKSHVLAGYVYSLSRGGAEGDMISASAAEAQR